PEITELYSVDSHEFSLRTCNEAFFYLFFFRRCNCSLKFDLEIRNVLSVLTIKLESALSLRSVISPRKIFSVDNQETPQLAEGDMLASVGIGQGDPLNLRPYHPGDSMRRIAWKIFAKKRELVVRELEKNLTDSKDVILLVDPLVSDDPLVNLVLEFVKNLKNAECNLAYCTTVSGKIFEDFERFREELLESGNNGFRVSLERLFNENFLEFSQKALVVALSDDLRNQAKFSLLRSFSGGISMEFLIGPTVAKKSSLRKYVFKNDLDFELRYDKACSVLLA
ncbi:MAG: DUF58 domain-containing protein, partial [Deltaproteobacteria bacterium]|nr:DUF58 domain-containing protein [Deltaproteobacteria bacterium]